MKLKFKTAYFIAKEELPFTQFKGKIKKNDVKLNATHNNDTACTQHAHAQGQINFKLNTVTSEAVSVVNALQFM